MLQRFRTGWESNFEDLNLKFRVKNLSKEEVDDLNIIRKASIQVRRKALKDLLLDEYKIYETELDNRGLCFHKERI